jgi:SAM-dependent methyltransferase
MLLADPEAALREARRVLRPGRRIAIAVWDPIDRNPWIGVILKELQARELAPAPAPGAPGMFALAEPGRAGELLESAGFSDVRSEPIEFAFHAPDPDAWWEHNRTMSISLGKAIAGLTPAEHYALREAVDAGYAQYQAADGSLTLPATALGVTAEA